MQFGHGVRLRHRQRLPARGAVGLVQAEVADEPLQSLLRGGCLRLVGHGSTIQPYGSTVQPPVVGGDGRGRKDGLGSATMTGQRWARHAIAALAVTALAVLAALLLVTGPALAHASLKSST